MPLKNKHHLKICTSYFDEDTNSIFNQSLDDTVEQLNEGSSQKFIELSENLNQHSAQQGNNNFSQNILKHTIFPIDDSPGHEGNMKSQQLIAEFRQIVHDIPQVQSQVYSSIVSPQQQSIIKHFDHIKNFNNNRGFVNIDSENGNDNNGKNKNKNAYENIQIKSSSTPQYQDQQYNNHHKQLQNDHNNILQRTFYIDNDNSTSLFQKQKSTMMRLRQNQKKQRDEQHLSQQQQQEMINDQRMFNYQYVYNRQGGMGNQYYFEPKYQQQQQNHPPKHKKNIHHHKHNYNNNTNYHPPTTITNQQLTTTNTKTTTTIEYLQSLQQIHQHNIQRMKSEMNKQKNQRNRLLQACQYLNVEVDSLCRGKCDRLLMLEKVLGGLENNKKSRIESNKQEEKVLQSQNHKQQKTNKINYIQPSLSTSSISQSSQQSQSTGSRVKQKVQMKRQRKSLNINNDIDLNNDVLQNNVIYDKLQRIQHVLFKQEQHHQQQQSKQQQQYNTLWQQIFTQINLLKQQFTQLKEQLSQQELEQQQIRRDDRNKLNYDQQQTVLSKANNLNRVNRDRMKTQDDQVTTKLPSGLLTPIKKLQTQSKMFNKNYYMTQTPYLPTPIGVSTSSRKQKFTSINNNNSQPQISLPQPSRFYQSHMSINNPNNNQSFQLTYIHHQLLPTLQSYQSSVNVKKQNNQQNKFISFTQNDKNIKQVQFVDNDDYRKYYPYSRSLILRELQYNESKI